MAPRAPLISLSISLFLPLVFVAQTRKSNSDYDPITSLVVTVTGNLEPTDSVEEFNVLLEEIIRDYSDTRPEIKREVLPIDVLSYLENIYADHGYNESGSWLPKIKNHKNLFLPHISDLPDYVALNFRKPVEGKVSSRYGFRPKFGRIHRGVDVALKTGDTVRCALPGKVRLISYDATGYGLYVVVTHAEEVETLYAHLSQCLVSQGQMLQAGDHIGKGGMTGNATGPHLHFETRLHGIALDPISLFIP